MNRFETMKIGEQVKIMCGKKNSKKAKLIFEDLLDIESRGRKQFFGVMSGPWLIIERTKFDRQDYMDAKRTGKLDKPIRRLSREQRI